MVALQNRYLIQTVKQKSINIWIRKMKKEKKKNFKWSKFFLHFPTFQIFSKITPTYLCVNILPGASVSHVSLQIKVIIINKASS